MASHLAGTPLQNKVEDVQSLLEFLGASPLSDASIFRRAISRPLRAGCTEALTKLALMFKAICLRRGKDALPEAARLPPKTVSACGRETPFVAPCVLISFWGG